MGCGHISEIPHPEIELPLEPRLPAFTRDMLDCGQHNPDTLPLCYKIKERETYLRDYIETIQILVDSHNKLLKD